MEVAIQREADHRVSPEGRGECAGQVGVPTARVLRGELLPTGAHTCGVTLRLIEPGMPNQNAYIESFNGRFRNECFNEHWFACLAHTEVFIETWRREYNEERAKQGLGGLTPAQYAKRLVAERSTVTIGL